jgi:hypothetical protein
MLSDRLIQLIEKQADRLTKSWVKMIRTNENTPTYHSLSDVDLRKRIHDVYQHLGKWLNWELSSEQVIEFFIQLGRKRKRQNVPLSELCYAIILSRRNLIITILEEGIFSGTLDFQRVIEFNSRISLFFDKAIYFTIKGYEEHYRTHEEEPGVLSKLLQSFSMGVFPEKRKST